jgi:hypothetical protein
VTSPGRYCLGAEKAFLFRIVTPLFLLNAGVLSLIWSPLEGIMHALFAALAGAFIVGIRFRAIRVYPFTLEFKGSVSNQFTGSLFFALVITGFMVMLQYWASGFLLLFLGLIAGMALLHHSRFFLMRRAGEEEA